MSARQEIAKKHAAEYAKASKKAKGVILDQLVATTSWSRANTRRVLTAAAKRKGAASAMKRKPRGRMYGYDTLRLLIQVWDLAGRPSGKYLSATMVIWLPKLEKYHELDATRLNEHTRAQLLAVSGATIDRLLKPTRGGAQLVGLSGTRPVPLLRNSIQVRMASDEHEQAPGFVEADLVLHCGPQSARGVRALADGDRRLHRVDREHYPQERRPPVGDRGLFFTRSRPYKPNDNAHVE